ncbi:hypothetical protein IE4872_PD01324 (plasmid) [Rhizobium gallicum]|uniref:Uncharacterized protein n=1 Tax=Rhizobium gallicum TaxID=56730 RepID=A0A1L5NVG3_9HYPH|nr:hypothetical protein IE4872_PD01324 [Rhizobium gallicum]
MRFLEIRNLLQELLNHALTYGYAGHQMIEQARAMVKNGDLGEIRIVNLQFAHGFHSAPVDQNPSRRWTTASVAAIQKAS